MINLVERALLAFAVVLSIALGAAAGVVSVVFPAGLRSGVSAQAAEAEVATADWLADRRSERGLTHAAAEQFVEPPAESPLRAPRDRSAFRQAVRRVIRSTAPGRSGGAPVPGIPWLRQEPGVRYQPLRRVPPLVARRLRSFEGSRAELQRGRGRFVRTDHGDAYQLDAVAPKSQIARAGLQPGDQILAVNGLPVGRGVEAARGLFDRLRDEPRYTILVLRNGRRVVIALEVSR